VAVADGGKDGAGTVRVMVYCLDNFILALPITRADQAAAFAPAAAQAAAPAAFAPAPAAAVGGGDRMGGSGGGGGGGTGSGSGSGSGSAGGSDRKGLTFVARHFIQCITTMVA